MKLTVGLLLLTFAFTFSFSSCSDDELKDAFVTYPHELKLYQIDQHQIRIFTSKGEITDKKIINSYFNSYGEYIKGWMMQHNDEFVKKPSSLDHYKTVTYHAVDSLSIVNWQYGLPYPDRNNWFRTPYKISKEKDLLYLTSSFNSTTFPPDKKNKDYLFPTEFAKFQAPLEKHPELSGYLIQKEMAIAKGNNLHLEMYTYICGLRRGDTEYISPHNMIFNIFDKDKITLLAPNDTLLILEHTFKYAPEHGLYPIVTGKSESN